MSRRDIEQFSECVNCCHYQNVFQSLIHALFVKNKRNWIFKVICKKKSWKKFNNNFKNPICQISDQSSEFLVELKD